MEGKRALARELKKRKPHCAKACSADEATTRVPSERKTRKKLQGDGAFRGRVGDKRGGLPGMAYTSLMSMRA